MIELVASQTRELQKDAPGECEVQGLEFERSNCLHIEDTFLLGSRIRSRSTEIFESSLECVQFEIRRYLSHLVDVRIVCS